MLLVESDGFTGLASGLPAGRLCSKASFSSPSPPRVMSPAGCPSSPQSGGAASAPPIGTVAAPRRLAMPRLRTNCRLPGRTTTTSPPTARASCAAPRCTRPTSERRSGFRGKSRLRRHSVRCRTPRPERRRVPHVFRTCGGAGSTARSGRRHGHGVRSAGRAARPAPRRGLRRRGPVTTPRSRIAARSTATPQRDRSSPGRHPALLGDRRNFCSTAGSRRTPGRRTADVLERPLGSDLGRAGRRTPGRTESRTGDRPPLARRTRALRTERLSPGDAACPAACCARTPSRSILWSRAARPDVARAGDIAAAAPAWRCLGRATPSREATPEDRHRDPPHHRAGLG